MSGFVHIVNTKINGMAGILRKYLLHELGVIFILSAILKIISIYSFSQTVHSCCVGRRRSYIFFSKQK